MAVSEARIRANQANAAKSTGPKTTEGKAVSRGNAYKHGMTGEGVVVPPQEAAEVERRFSAFVDELQPSGSLGMTLVRRAATLAVRMEKCAEREMAITAERVARAVAEFEAPDGADPAEVARLRAEVAQQAGFDPSKEACLARRYEAAAERGFFRALKEFRLVEKKAATARPTDDAESFREALGSFLEMKRMDQEMAAEYPELALPELKNPFDDLMAARFSSPAGRVDVPMTIGRAR